MNHGYVDALAFGACVAICRALGLQCCVKGRSMVDQHVGKDRCSSEQGRDELSNEQDMGPGSNGGRWTEWTVDVHVLPVRHHSPWLVWFCFWSSVEAAAVKSTKHSVTFPPILAPIITHNRVVQIFY